jgi:hypothetical protein
MGTTRGTTFDTTFVPRHVRLNSRTAKFVLALVRHSMNFIGFASLSHLVSMILSPPLQGRVNKASSTKSLVLCPVRGSCVARIGFFCQLTFTSPQTCICDTSLYFIPGDMSWMLEIPVQLWAFMFYHDNINRGHVFAH